jgi:hypothetical protein
MNFVYICKNGDNEELRYSIRSVINSFPNANVWVVGGKPDWYVGNYIFVKQDKTKYTNAIENLKSFCDSESTPKEFYLMNDDFFILKKIDSIESFHGDLLYDKINKYLETDNKSRYASLLGQTYKRLLALKIQNPIDYELHVPMKMEKEKLKIVLSKHNRFLWRSIYGNLFNINGTKINDVKIYKDKKFDFKSYNINNESIFVSTDDRSFEEIKENFLKNLFPNKTRYESN